MPSASRASRACARPIARASCAAPRTARGRAGRARRLEEALRPLLRDVGDATFNVTAPTAGCSRRASRTTAACSAARRALPRRCSQPVFDGESRFVRPFRDADRVAARRALRAGPPFAWIATPVRGRGRPRDRGARHRRSRPTACSRSILAGRAARRDAARRSLSTSAARLLTPSDFGETRRSAARLHARSGRGHRRSSPTATTAAPR